MTVIEDLTKTIEEEESSIDKHGEEILQAIVGTTEEDKDGELHSFCYAIKDPGLEALQKSKGKHADILMKICTDCVRKQRIDYYSLAAEIFESKDYINWKDRAKEAETIIAILLDPMTLVRTENDDWWSKERAPAATEQGEALKNCIEKMIEAFVRDKIIKKVNNKLMEVLISSYARDDEMSHVLGCGIANCSDMNYDGTEKMLPDLYKAMLEWLRREENDITDYGERSSLVCDTISNIGEKGVKAATELSEVFSYILTQELDGQPTSGYGTVAMNILSYTVMRNTSNTKAIKPFIPGTMKLMKCECEQLEEMASHAIGSIYQQTELLIPCTDIVMEVLIEGKGTTTLGMVLQPLYKDAPDKVMKYFDQLAERATDDMDDSEKNIFYMFLGDVAKREPKRLLPYLENIVADLESTICVHMAFQVIAELTAGYPKEVEKYSDELIETWDRNPMTVSFACKALANIGRMDEIMADIYLTILAERLETIDPMWKVVILMEMKRIGQAFREPLKKHRAQIEAEKSGTQPGLPDMAQSIIDFLEDRTLENLSTEVAEQRDDIGDLDNRVTGTEDNINRLDTEITEQGEKLEDVQNDVTEQGERLDNLEEVVDDLVVKVDEIDHKTITNAPKWSRDIAEILNVEDEYDWRYLAIRLGYSGEDVRNWALSTDPTMAILAEWYTTHKSSDATFAILTALQDMGRTEAAAIVEKALEAADKLVPKQDGETPDKPCPVFISYQWDHQLEVKVIKDHLEMAGYRCWMDIGQMGGGDQLFAKINEGMRGAKIVLCMVTTKYAKSENCNKEVNLANLLNKPIIPILIENISWPPEGSMSMLFAQLLYIQFFGKYVRGEKFWPDERFHELLGQIGYNASPDPEMITPEYQDWIPKIEDTPEVKVVKKAEENAPSKAAEQEPAEQQPTVFISYQWDKQPQIKTLFNQLTKLGFLCWLDIMQMGGGDPLYAKIDKGIRNAKVVLSCVTSKYSLSANCRREVSLSDALGKPIIPLLLEEGMAWPPSGPMSMTFAQLLYIDFTKESSQSEFQDGKFDGLLHKIEDYVQPNEVILQDSGKDFQGEQNHPGSEFEAGEATPSASAAGEDDITPVRPSSAESMPTQPASESTGVPERPASASPNEGRRKKSSVCICL